MSNLKKVHYFLMESHFILAKYQMLVASLFVAFMFFSFHFITPEYLYSVDSKQLTIFALLIISLCSFQFFVLFSIYCVFTLSKIIYNSAESINHISFMFHDSAFFKATPYLLILVLLYTLCEFFASYAEYSDKQKEFRQKRKKEESNASTIIHTL